MMYTFCRDVLFRLEAERAHNITLALIGAAGRLPPLAALLRRLFQAPRLPVSAFGLEFANPLGLAAGYDKDATAWQGLACLGFGHIEVGTITPRPQPGNPHPRLYRLPDDQALINRMGFPGRGADYAAGQLKRRRPPGLVLGANLGKNKNTPLEEAAQDYLALLPVFAPLVDYLAINVSSPNTAGLRRLQARQALEALLGQLAQQRQHEVSRLGRAVPMLVKLSPDLAEAELDDALGAILDCRMEGVIATNTTIDRPALRSPAAGETGGLSGAPLRERSTAMIRAIVQRTQGKLPVIGAGGVLTPADAQEKLEAGATLVQVYTGLVYSGPGLVKQTLRHLFWREQPAKGWEADEGG
jgi:dihydroorotate dehydrogenase